MKIEHDLLLFLSNHPLVIEVLCVHDFMAFSKYLSIFIPAPDLKETLQLVYRIQCFSQKILLEDQSSPVRLVFGAIFLGKGPIDNHW